jgi:bZIP factor
MVGPVKNEASSLSPNTDNIQQQQHYRLQLLAQAIEKVESECSQKQLTTPISVPKKQHQIPIDSLSMASSSSQQQQELLMQLFTQPNVAAVMAAAAAAAQFQAQQQQQQRKLEPISPPSTSSASSSAESPIDFSSHRSTEDMNECSSPPPSQQLFPTTLQNYQASNSFPFLLTNKNGKPTRPFKAYPREPLMLPLGFCSNATSEQANILADAASRATPNRKRLAQTQERLKQRIQQQQQQLLSTTHFISSSGAQILQPPKKRHRMMENTIVNEEKSSTKDNNNEIDNGIKDDAYWERRRKNNEAAKRSRDARRAKEDEIALRAAILEQENIKLRLELSQLKQETAKLRCMVHASS